MSFIVFLQLILVHAHVAEVLSQVVLQLISQVVISQVVLQLLLSVDPT